MKVLICGSRDITDKDYVYMNLNKLYMNYNIDLIITGGASGVDTLAVQWADEHDIPSKIFPANWSLHGKSAGSIRNQQMIDLEPDLVVAFPGGKGTEDMVQRAMDNRVSVIFV